MSDCILFVGCKDAFGYGMKRIKLGGKWVTRRAHLLAYEAVKGPRGKLCVLHTCDNPPCINPEHLVLGTRADNNADRDRKGRHIALAGEAHGCARLTAPIVQQIRQLRSAGVKLRELAMQFEVSEAHISSICRGRTWRSV